MEQEQPTLPEHPSSPPEVHVARSLVFYVFFCRSLFVLVSFFFWPLCCLFCFDLRIMITPLVSWNSSCRWFRQVGDFLWVLKFPPPIKLTHYITEILSIPTDFTGSHKPNYHTTTPPPPPPFMGMKGFNF